MGVKKFFPWLKNNHSTCMTLVKNEIPIKVDNLCLDMNGFYHNAAQKIFRYGNHKADFIIKDTQQKRLKFYELVCETIDLYVKIVKPTKRLVLCVDGSAPVSKQKQMRSRRFVKNEHALKGGFDSNQITTGTKLMDFLSKYIDFYIRKKMMTDWSHLEVIFSTERDYGEGEHKIIKFIKKHPNDKTCLHGLDADLIFLTLFTHIKNIYLLRENTESKYDDVWYFFIDITLLHKTIAEELKWSEDNEDNFLIDDFVFMCYFVGNDFLPNVACIEIIQNGIEHLINIYKSNKQYLIVNETFNVKGLQLLLKDFSQFEETVVNNKMDNPKYFPDNLATATCDLDENGKNICNIKKYRKFYYSEKLQITDEKEIETLCHKYFEGLLWVFNYYRSTIKSWTWCFKEHYAPFSYDLAKYITTFKFNEFELKTPYTPFMQLLCVLPKKSFYNIPKELEVLQEHLNLDEEVKIDLSGMINKYEGISLISVVDFDKFIDDYNNLLLTVDKKDIPRNVYRCPTIYILGHRKNTFKSFYGEIETAVFNKNYEF